MYERSKPTKIKVMKPRYKIVTMLGNKEYTYTVKGEVFVLDKHYKFVDMDNKTSYYPIINTIITEQDN